jgi:hypothetical protein
MCGLVVSSKFFERVGVGSSARSVLFFCAVWWVDLECQRQVATLGF